MCGDFRVCVQVVGAVYNIKDAHDICEWLHVVVENSIVDHVLGLDGYCLSEIVHGDSKYGA